jgi:hypothetical protein
VLSSDLSEWKKIHVLSVGLSKWKENIHVSSIGLSKWENINVSSELSKWRKDSCVVLKSADSTWVFFPFT